MKPLYLQVLLRYYCGHLRKRVEKMVDGVTRILPR